MISFTISGSSFSRKETKRTKPRYSELQADVAKYKALYENSQSQVDTLKKILSLISKDLKVNISAIDHALASYL